MLPSGIRPGVRRLFQLASRSRDTGAEVDDEIRFHLEERIAQLVAHGMEPAAARLEAERRFGDITEARANLRQSADYREQRMRTREWIASVMQDVRFAWRGLSRAPGFLPVAVACLALGIGANVAIFSVIDAVLFKPLPFARPHELVSVWPDGAVPPGIHEILQRDGGSYGSLAGYESGRQASITGTGDPVRLVVSQTTVNFFETLGVQPAMGRGFRRGEHLPGAGSVVVLAHALWTERFGADSTVIGRTLTIDGRSHRIVGVAAANFRFPSTSVALWVPAQPAPGSPAYWWSTYFRLVGRLERGSTPAMAEAEAAVLFPRARSSFPMRMPDEWGAGVRVVPLQEEIAGSARQTLLLLLGAVGLVLLMVCVNLATLYVGRAASRAREIAVRAALGGGQGRILRLLFTESMVVALLGATAGLALAAAVMRTLVAMLPEGTPRTGEITIDARVLAFTILLTATSALIFGLLPAWRASRGDLASALRANGRSGGNARQGRGAAMLATTQVALAVVLISSAGMLVKSLYNLQKTELGFRSAGTVTTAIPLPSFPNDTARRAPVFYTALLDGIRTSSGVRAAALASALPFGDGLQYAAMEVEAHPTPPGEAPPAPHLTAVSDGYFETLGIPLVRGRFFSVSDRAGAARVAVIDGNAARRLWPDADAIGQRIRYVWNQEWFTVVGVVGNVKRDSLSGAYEPSVYVPMSQSFPREMRLLVSSTRDAGTTATSIRQVVRRVDDSVPVGETRALDDVVSGSAARSRFATMLLSLFAAVALLLGALGIYGVISSGVARRTREIGVRMAVGATRTQIARMVLNQSLVISAGGAVIGVVGAGAAWRWLRGMLYGVGAIEPTVMGAVAALLALVAVGAAVAPARRAAGVDPLVAMRAD